MGRRIVLWTQSAVLVATLAGSLGLLVAAVVRTGDTGALLAPGLERLGDPAESVPGAWNPIFWLMVPGVWFSYLIYPVGILALLTGGVLMVFARRAGDRKVFRAAAVVTALWLVVTVVAFTPYGRDLHRWLLD